MVKQQASFWQSINNIGNLALTDPKTVLPLAKHLVDCVGSAFKYAALTTIQPLKEKFADMQQAIPFKRQSNRHKGVKYGPYYWAVATAVTAYGFESMAEVGKTVQEHTPAILANHKLSMGTLALAAAGFVWKTGLEPAYAYSIDVMQEARLHKMNTATVNKVLMELFVKNGRCATAEQIQYELDTEEIREEAKSMCCHPNFNPQQLRQACVTFPQLPNCIDKFTEYHKLSPVANKAYKASQEFNKKRQK